MSMNKIKRHASGPYLQLSALQDSILHHPLLRGRIFWSWIAFRRIQKSIHLLVNFWKLRVCYVRFDRKHTPHRFQCRVCIRFRVVWFWQFVTFYVVVLFESNLSLLYHFCMSLAPDCPTKFEQSGHQTLRKEWNNLFTKLYDRQE